MKRIRNWLGYPILVVGIIFVAIGLVLRHGLGGATLRINKMTDSLNKDKK